MFSFEIYVCFYFCLPNKNYLRERWKESHFLSKTNIGDMPKTDVNKMNFIFFSKKKIGYVPKTDANKINFKIIYEQGGKSFAFQDKHW
jgi:hypothetical protein